MLARDGVGGLVSWIFAEEAEVKGDEVGGGG